MLVLKLPFVKAFNILTMKFKSNLHRRCDENLCEDGKQVWAGCQRSLRTFRHQFRVTLDPAHEDGHGRGDGQIDVQELGVAEIGLFETKRNTVKCLEI